jgi:hypothetical protein
LLKAAQNIHTLYHERAKAVGIGIILGVSITVIDEIIGIIQLLKEEVSLFLDRGYQF